MQLPKIEIRHLSKVFFHNILDTFKKSKSEAIKRVAKDKIVLNDLNVDIHSGDVVGIIGINGAGKSTLLSIIAGVTKQTRGEVNVTGKVTAVMTLGVGLREDLTGRENIYIDGEIQGKSHAEINAVIDEIISFSELGEFIDKRVKIYSTGMKSRLAFSMLVCIEPEILIIDEALSAGDVFFAEKAAKKIRDICERGKIVILVSHSMTTIKSMCNRCIWMDKGKIRMDGEPNAVTQSYLDNVSDEDNSTESYHYRDDLSEVAPHANYMVRSIRLYSDIRAAAIKVFYTGTPFFIEVGIEQRKRCDTSLSLSIERLDGLLVDYQCLALNEIHHSEYHVQFSLMPLVLNKGLYLLRINLKEDQQITNRFVRLFEVKNNNMPDGGHALIHYPADITLMNEEKIL